MSRDDRIYLADIAKSCDKILRFTEGYGLDQLISDEKSYDAVVRNLEIIGEAAKQIPEGIRGELSQIEWKKIAGMRDMLIHAYFGIDNDILWDVVQDKVPHLLNVVRSFLDEKKRNDKS